MSPGGLGAVRDVVKAETVLGEGGEAAEILFVAHRVVEPIRERRVLHLDGVDRVVQRVEFAHPVEEQAALAPERYCAVGVVRQADIGEPAELAAALQQCTGVDIEAAFEPEERLGAAAQVFCAGEAPAEPDMLPDVARVMLCDWPFVPIAV